MQEPETEQLDHNELLVNLKKSVELWFLTKRDDVILPEMTEFHESTIPIQSAIKSILLNGLKSEGTINFYQNFTNDLNWLHASSLQNSSCLESVADILKKNSDFLSLWIYQSMQLQSLCSSLQLLAADKELLENYYTMIAFVRNDKYSTAMFICLSAFELKQSSLLSQIDTSLYNNQLQLQPTVLKHHKRSTSHPNFSISPKKINLKFEQSSNKIQINPLAQQCLKMIESMKATKQSSNNKYILNRKWKSLPNIKENYFCNRRPRSKTFSQAISIPKTKNQHKKYNQFSLGCDSVEIHSPNPEITCLPYYSTPVSSVSTSNCSSSKKMDCPKINCIKCDDIKIHLDRDYEHLNTPKNLTPSQSGSSDNITSPHRSSSLKGLSPINFLSSISANIFSPSPKIQNSTNVWPIKDESNSSSFSGTVSSNVFGFAARDGEKILNTNSRNFFDDIIIQNENSRDISSVSSRSSIVDGQNLTSLLQTNFFSRNNTELERENAHFKISETIISVIEHIKWTKVEKEKIKANVNVKENIDVEKTNEVLKKSENCKTIKDIKKDTKKVKIKDAVETGTSYLDDSKDSETIYYAESASEGDCDDIEINLNETNEHNAYAEWGANSYSAEGVALSLISKFGDTQLPKVSELIWLVSEEDAPQKLLPLPDFSSENPDDHVVHSFTRGTRDWAPPRQQIIFTEHPQTNRKDQMKSQNYRCAGCGMRVAPMYMSRYRYCTYLGKYHCTGCHRNHISIIPAKVLNRWDFTLYPVSVFSYRLLEQILTYPLFYVSNLSPTLYRRVKSLNIIKYRRTQLKFLKYFITSCRFAINEIDLFNEIPVYYTDDVDKWSMSDFIDTKNGKLIKTFDSLIKNCEKHVFDCVLCTARGFVCELCCEKEICCEVIFPWQSKVKRCDNCGTCFHLNCWKKILNTQYNCVKCQRLTKRQLNEEFSSSLTITTNT